MKTNRIILVIIVLMSIGVFAFRKAPGGTIKGTVIPTDGAARIWALSNYDTFKTTSNNMGMFQITNVRPGTYRVLVEANPPYLNAFKDNITVTEGNITDAGDFRVTRQPGKKQE